MRVDSSESDGFLLAEEVGRLVKGCTHVGVSDYICVL